MTDSRKNDSRYSGGEDLLNSYSKYAMSYDKKADSPIGFYDLNDLEQYELIMFTDLLAGKDFKYEISLYNLKHIYGTYELYVRGEGKLYVTTGQMAGAFLLNGGKIYKRTEISPNWLVKVPKSMLNTINRDIRKGERAGRGR